MVPVLVLLLWLLLLLPLYGSRYSSLPCCSVDSKQRLLLIRLLLLLQQLNSPS